MQEPIAITLRPDRVTVAAGGSPAQVVAVVKNQTPVVDSYRLEISDLHPDWYSLPGRDLTLFPNEQKALTISFQPPADFSTLAGRYDYKLWVRSTVENARQAAAEGVLRVTLPEALNLRLKRDLVRGQVGEFELTVTNRTTSAQTVTFLTEQEEEALDFNFDPAGVEIAPGRSQMVKLTTRLHTPQAQVEAQAFAFALTAQTVDGRGQSNRIEGQFLYTPAQIRMELLPARIRGTRGRFNLNVANPGIDAAKIELSASDPEGALAITFQVDTLELQPGTSVILPLTVQLRPERKPEARPYSFTVSVRQEGVGPTAEVGPPVTGQLIYEPAIELQVAIEPGPMSGAQGDFTVKLRNPSPAGLRLSLRAQDPQHIFQFFFGIPVDQIVLAAGGKPDVPLPEAPVPLFARLTSIPDAPQAAYPFTVTVHAIPDDGSMEFDVTATGEFLYLADQPILRMDLLPDRVRGEVGHFQVRLASGVGQPLLIIMRGRDDGGALQYDFSPPRVQLAPNTVELVDLTVQPRNGLDGFRDYPFEVIAWVPGTGTDGATVHPASWFFVPPPEPEPAPLDLELYPMRVIGPQGQFQVRMENRGDDPLTVVLRASDDAEALQFLYQVPRVELQPKEAAEVSLIVQGRDGAPLPAPYRYPFEVAGWVPGSVTGTSSVQHGELVVIEPPPRPATWPSTQKLAIIALIIGWIILPFVLGPLGRRFPAIGALTPLVFTYLPMFVLPVIGAVMYGKSPSELRGWRAVVIGLLGFSAILMYFIPFLLPPMLFGLPTVTFVGLILLPVLLIVLFA